MSAVDARPVPKKAIAYRHYFAIHNASGALISGATALDSEVSIDGAAFADCVAEATEIGVSGIYFLDLTAAEMTGDCVVVVVRTSSPGVVAPVIVLFPQEDGDLRVSFDDHADTMARLGIADAGAAQSVSPTTLTLRASAVFADGALAGAMIFIPSLGASGRVSTNVGDVVTLTSSGWSGATPTGTPSYVLFRLPEDDLGADITAVKAKTDQLAFSAPGILDANIERINAEVVVGDGTLGNPWRR